ncbi:MAG: SDR family oxidoreductase [Syntrophobacteraceae bacterium]|nr:SDR family oxidoreductase [Syntrophobacteraceae bacterium]
MNFCDLTGKNILVTGASSGLGRATSVLVSKLNGRVCLIGRNEAALDETLSMMEGAGHIIISIDLCDYSRYDWLFGAVTAEFGMLHGLVHFAGVRKTLPVKVLKTESLKQMLEINLNAFLELVRYFTRKHVPDPEGAAIVAVSSVSALRGAPAMTGYACTKAALDGAVRSLACEMAPRKIRVNSIAPGHVETEMNVAVKNTLSVEAYNQIIQTHPLGTGQPTDVANLVAFLLSDEARWITGTTIFIDGGFMARS